MLAQSERLGRLVEQLLDLSKLESGEVPLRREGVPLGPVVRRSCPRSMSLAPTAMSPCRAMSRTICRRSMRTGNASTRCCSTWWTTRSGSRRRGRGALSRRTVTTDPSRSAWPTPASGSPPSTSRGCSSGSTGSTPPVPVGTAAPGSAWRSPVPSWRRTGAHPRRERTRPREYLHLRSPGRRSGQEQEGPLKSTTTTVTIAAPERYAYLDLTDDLQRAIKDSGVTEGAVIAFCAHTTCALLINEWEDGAIADFRRQMTDSCRTKGSTTSTTTSRSARRTSTRGTRQRARTCQADAALATSHAIPVVSGEPGFGTWQRLIFFEMDEPKDRTITFHVFGRERPGVPARRRLVDDDDHRRGAPDPHRRRRDRRRRAGLDPVDDHDEDRRHQRHAAQIARSWRRGWTSSGSPSRTGRRGSV